MAGAKIDYKAGAKIEAEKDSNTSLELRDELITPSTMVEIHSLDHFFGEASALYSVDLTLFTGDRAALMGPNGAGKSTLMKIIAGALTKGTGKVLVNGKSPYEARCQAGFLGWLPEGAPLNPDLTVLEHLKMAAKLKGISSIGAGSEIERLTIALDLKEKLSRLAGRLSLGTRRQVALALAFMGTPKLLLLDEPTSSLDPDEVKRVGALIRDLDPETTLLVSSHILSEAKSFTQKAIFLKGTVLAMGPWATLASELNLEPNASPSELYFKAQEL